NRRPRRHDEPRVKSGEQRAKSKNDFCLALCSKLSALSSPLFALQGGSGETVRAGRNRRWIAVACARYGGARGAGALRFGRSLAPRPHGPRGRFVICPLPV